MSVSGASREPEFKRFHLPPARLELVSERWFGLRGVRPGEGGELEGVGGCVCVCGVGQPAALGLIHPGCLPLVLALGLSPELVAVPLP